MHLALWAPGSNLAVRVNRAIDDRPDIQQEAICHQWFKQRLILSVCEPSISQRSQIKEDTVEFSVPAREFNLKEYAAITWHRLADHRRQAALTATLPTAPLRQARSGWFIYPRIPLPRSGVRRPIEYTCQVSSMSDQRSWSLKVLKMFIFTDGHVTSFTSHIQRSD